MRKAILFFAVLAASPLASADTFVNGYTRSDGTYVQPHYRSSPNNTRIDNYSTRGNANPYTGKRGTQDPYPAPSYGYGIENNRRRNNYLYGR